MSSSGVLLALTLRAHLAQRFGPPLDRSVSSLSRPRFCSPDRPTAMLTIPTRNAAANPLMTPITVPGSRPPLHHHAPIVTSKATRTKTIRDKITVPDILAIIAVSPSYTPCAPSTQDENDEYDVGDDVHQPAVRVHPVAHLWHHPLRTPRSEEHTSELQSRQYLVCRLLLEKKKQ